MTWTIFGRAERRPSPTIVAAARRAYRSCGSDSRPDENADRQSMRAGSLGERWEVQGSPVGLWVCSRAFFPLLSLASVSLSPRSLRDPASLCIPSCPRDFGGTEYGLARARTRSGVVMRHSSVACRPKPRSTPISMAAPASPDMTATGNDVVAPVLSDATGLDPEPGTQVLPAASPAESIPDEQRSPGSDSDDWGKDWPASRLEEPAVPKKQAKEPSSGEAEEQHHAQEASWGSAGWGGWWSSDDKWRSDAQWQSGEKWPSDASASQAPGSSAVSCAGSSDAGQHGDDEDLTPAELQIKLALERAGFDKNSALAQRFRRGPGQSAEYKNARSHADKAKFRQDWLQKQYDQVRRTLMFGH